MVWELQETHMPSLRTFFAESSLRCQNDLFPMPPPVSLVVPIAPRRVDLFHGAHVLDHQTEPLPEFPRHLNRDPTIQRLVKFSLRCGRNVLLAVLFLFWNHGFSLSPGCQHPSQSEDFLAGAAADDAGGFKFGAVGRSSLPGDASRSVFGPGKLRYPDTARIVGRGGSMIRHAWVAAEPVFPLAVAVIEPSLPALLVPPVGGPPLLPPRFPPAALAAVLVPPGHNDGRSRTPRHSRPPGRTSAVGALRRSPCPPFRREGTTATRHGKIDPICRCTFVLSAALNAPPFCPGNMGE